MPLLSTVRSSAIRGLSSPWDRIDTPQTPLIPLGALNAYNAAWTAILGDIVPTGTEPTTNTSIGRYIVAPPPANYMGLVMVGTDGDNEFFDAKVFGWRPADDGIVIWTPSLLAELNGCVLGTNVGVSGASTLTTSVRFVDGFQGIIDHTYKNSIDVVGRVGSQNPPMVVMDISGFALVEVRTTLNDGAGTAATMGGAYTLF
jgi:hypothetical protein